MISYVKIAQPQFPIPTLLPHLGHGSPLELHWSPMRFCLMDPKLQPQWCLVSLGWGNCYFWSNWSPMCEFWVVDWGWLGWARPNGIEFGGQSTQRPQLDSNGPHWIPNGVQLEKWGTVKYSRHTAHGPIDTRARRNRYTGTGTGTGTNARLLFQK